MTTKATVLVVEASEEAVQLGFNTGECYKAQFKDAESVGDSFFDSVESDRGAWLPVSALIRTGSIIKYVLNEKAFSGKEFIVTANLAEELVGKDDILTYVRPLDYPSESCEVNMHIFKSEDGQEVELRWDSNDVSISEVSPL